MAGVVSFGTKESEDGKCIRYGMEEKKVKFAWFQCNDRKKDTTLSKLKKSYDEWSVK